MSKPVAYSVLIRDGQKRCFEDPCATLYRELIWGPEAYESWLSEGEEIDWEPEDLSGIAIVDFDQKLLTWGEGEALQHPRSFAAHQKLLQQSWAGFTISFLSESEMYAAVHDRPQDDEAPDEVDSYYERPETVNDAAELFEDDEDPDEENDEEDESQFDEDFPCAWATIIDQKGKIRQRALSQIPLDLITGVKSAVQELANVKAAEVPPEKAVKEGFWINLDTKEIGFWGGSECRRVLERLQKSWPKWKVAWAENGYADQCNVAGQPGIAMTDTDALVKFMPHVLSTTKFSVANIVEAMGGSLKKTALKATGCLMVVLAVPILLTGFFMDKLRESAYAVVALVAIVAVIFKVLESKVKNKFQNNPLSQREESDDSKPPVAGPLDDEERRREMDQLLERCGFPSLEELQPHFPESSTFDLLP